MGPKYAAATSLLPSAEAATASQFALGAVVVVQFWANSGLPQVNRQPNVAAARTWKSW
jgi:hypothetical protein